MSDFYPHKQTHPGGPRPLTLADGAPCEERPVSEFRDAGGLWLANTILHALGWTLILEHTEAAPDRLYAARTRYRGFDATVTKQGYERVARWLRDQGPALYAEAAHEGEAPSSKLEMAAFDAARDARRYATARAAAEQGAYAEADEFGCEEEDRRALTALSAAVPTAEEAPDGDA
jgi:hypothetical protein